MFSSPAAAYTKLAVLALAVVFLHTLANAQYGFHRDELLTFDNARHLAWGYVEYPPITPFLARAELELFGTSLRGFRFLAAVAQGLALFLTGLAARELGGASQAQLVAAVASGIGGHTLFSGSFTSYSSFDYLWWVLVAYFVIRLLKTANPQWWIAIGGAIGLGMMTKYTMGFLVLGVVGGVLLTTRRFLRSMWFWCGVVVTVLMVVPNVVWQIQHHFISLEFLRSIHSRDIARGWTDYFLLNQLWRSASPVTVPLWVIGLWYFFAVPEGKRYRFVGWMFVIPLVVLLAVRGRDYYLAPAYPMLLAAGSVWGERWIATLSTRSALAVRQNTWGTLIVAGLVTAALTFPVAPINSRWWRLADAANGGNFNSQVGWPDLVETVAKIRDSLPAQDHTALGIFAGDDGETGALNLYGPAYGLPTAISLSNSNWIRGYGDSPPRTVITVAMDHDFLVRNFDTCDLVGRVTNPYGIENAAIAYPDIYVCRHLRRPWPDFWEQFRYFG